MIDRHIGGRSSLIVHDPIIHLHRLWSHRSRGVARSLR
jgi:hypothetical protein